MIIYHSDNAEKIVDDDLYPDGANSPTRHTAYKCPCGKGKICYERVVGFNDFYAWFECKTCEKKYRIKLACGHFWELEEK